MLLINRQVFLLSEHQFKMLIFLTVFFLLAGNSDALQCFTNCSLGKYRFNTPFVADNKECQQRVSASKCSVNVEFVYHSKTYEVTHEHNSNSRDFIYITMQPTLSYDIRYACSEDTNCALSYIQNRISTMTSQYYDVPRIHAQLAPLIENSSKSNSIQCYNMKNAIVLCAPSEVCNVDYNPRSHKARARGCKYFSMPLVMVYDSETYTSFDITCNRNLCNVDTTLSEVKRILAEHGLTDSSGRRIAAGIREMASVFLLLVTSIFVLSFYF